MKIALLKCGDVDKGLLHIDGDYEDMFIRLFKEYIPQMQLTVFNVQNNEYPTDLSQFAGVISSGSPVSVYDDLPWIPLYEKYVQQLFQQKVKHVGICFGHQMIARALGGKVEKAKQGWGIGVRKVNIYATKPWMNNQTVTSFKLLASHQDQVIQLPENAELLAGNAHCPNSVFVIRDHVLGIQQHPEFTTAYHRASIDRRKNKIEKNSVDRAIQSLSDKADSGLICKWIENFFKSE